MPYFGWNMSEQQNKKNSNKDRNRYRRRRRNNKPQKKRELRRYGILFFDTLQKAKDSIMEIEEHAKSVDQLNIVIRAESDMEIEELTKHGKVFAGEAWALIHDRRVEDGWYDEPR